MKHYGFMVAMLAAFWLLLSGHYTTLLLSFGAASCLFVVWLIHRMDVIDHGTPIVRLSWRLIMYWPWLAWEILKANIDVAWRLIDPRLPVSPTVVEVTGSQKTDIGRVTYANSITLTPGTITIDLDGNRFLVHSLTRGGAESLLRGDMDRRVAKVEGHEP